MPCQITQSSDTVNVGLTAEFTGPRSALGAAKLQGLQLGVDEINAAGGVLGHQVKIVTVDAPDPVDTVPAVRKMLATDNVSLVIGPDVNSYQNALPIFEQAKMVNFTYIGTPGVYTQKQWQYSFRTAASDAFVGAAMVLYASQKGYKKIALVLDAEEGSQSLVPSITKTAAALGITIVAQPAVPTNVTSYAGYITQVLNAKPDAMLFSFTTSEASGFFFKQWQSLGGGNLPIIGSDFTSNADFSKAVGADYAAANVVSVVPSLGTTSPAGTRFLAAFQAKFNQPPRLYAAHFYDGLMVGMLAMVAACSSDPSVYVNSVLDVTTPGTDRTVVYTYADGVKALLAGNKIKYSGAGGEMVYNAIHTTAGPYQIVKVDPAGNLTVVGDISEQSLAPLTQGSD